MDILLTIMAFFGLIGLIDDLIGGKIGVSDEFNRGLASMGSLAIAYSGFYCIGTALIERNAQSIAQVTSNLPFDPSLITSCLLCADTGGLNIALALSNTQALGIFCGALIGGGLGLTIGFQMPVFMSTLDKRFLPQFMQGIGYGLIALPAGLIVGGFLLGLSVMELLINLTPVVVLCIVLIFAFKINLDKSVRVLIVIANAVRIVSYIFFGLVVVGLFVPQLAIADTSDVEEIIYAVLRTTVVTAGGLVMSKLVIRYCQKPLSLFTRILRVNNESVIGLLVSCVSGVAMIPMIPKMDRRGQVMNAAFVVCGAYVIGGQMAFVSQMIPASSMPAFMLNKLISGILAAMLAGIVVRPEQSTTQQAPVVSPSQ